jgi:hypothetical protein
MDTSGAAAGPAGMHGLWSGSNSSSSRGTTPCSTTSSNGGRLQPQLHRQASEPLGRVSHGCWGGQMCLLSTAAHAL